MKKTVAGMQNKIWQVRPAHADAAGLSEQLNITPLFAQVLLNRKLSEIAHARGFLSPKLTDLIEPTRMPGLTAAVHRMMRAVSEKEKIAIYGDYDVDGITSVAILWHLLQMLGADVDYYIPHRVDEGYGLNDEAVRQLAEAGTQLLITVDCGVTAVRQVRLAGELGMDVIVTDHHQLGAELPPAEAIVHPLLDSDYANPASSGAMVAFKLAWGVAEAHKRGGRIPDALRQFLLNATTLAGIGTIADVVDLRGENRVLAGYGLRAVEQSGLVGVRALIETAQLAGDAVNSYDVAFKLAPMLNAAGRMGHARLAVELLTTDNQVRALYIAQYLKEQNRLRQKCQRDIFKQAKARILQHGLNHPDRKTIVLADENWHSGVIGIVASRIIDEFYRPTILINTANGLGQGSGRSIEGFNLYASLAACSEHLVSFGGHEMAAGLKVETRKVGDFSEAFEAYAQQSLGRMTLESFLDIEAETCIGEFNDRLMRELKSLEPFGQGNPRPMFATRGVRLIAPPRRVGARSDHLQLSIADATGAVRCIGFGMGNLEKKLLEIDSFSVAYEPQHNTYNGKTMLQFVLSDIRFD
ncbi:MAG TPA: single-stranded-DNA-specific exonuclease RecJ [Phycisphaerales bacterium]|nr:single-stranded-DNA-specific exonuclease RecJ [Phycisphaerales bacterium]